MRTAFAVLFIILATPALAVECPKDAKSCKVLVLTDEQVKTMETFMENTCVSGPYSQIKQVIDFYKDMLAKAPDGDAPAVKK